MRWRWEAIRSNPKQSEAALACQLAMRVEEEVGRREGAQHAQ